MRVTTENWKQVERDLKESGVKAVDYDEQGFVQTVTSGRGVSYELSPDIVKQLVESGVVAVELGRMEDRG